PRFENHAERRCELFVFLLWLKSVDIPKTRQATSENSTKAARNPRAVLR
ncbi:uncharacterized, partial [Tachysurus ichikawai]